ncbi:HTH domain-containing protein [Metabacillus fastidiosus]|uniref:HTH domain-containing protein n=1 Tax=Metabacillus fastidiosus TaxID=1458 RepID=UPI003D2C35DD
MLVKDVINKIINKEITIKDLAKQFQVSNRTVQNKIKRLGYEWDSKNAKYNYVGSEPEPLEVKFDSLFNNNHIASKELAKEELIQNENETASTVIDSTKLVTKNQNKSEYDAIDLLLASETKAKRIYRGFYFDEDIINIIDSVDKRKKSELINQALRKIFEEKGLL